MISLLFQYRSHHLARRQVQLFIGLNFLFYGFQCSENQNPKFLSNKIDSSNFLKREVSQLTSFTTRSSTGIHGRKPIGPGPTKKSDLGTGLGPAKNFRPRTGSDQDRKKWQLLGQVFRGSLVKYLYPDI